ncbi:hypothetical protein N7524_008680 [Penicillium chrysogenum]|nr:hypothetical protein N7524_008680 [Penicillium chrysogenum]
MAPVESPLKQEQLRKRRIKQEQLRKRRNNLLRRHNDFWRLYSIKSWVIMEMPNGRLYTYYSHPDVAVPTKQEITQRPQPAVHKSPPDYGPHESANEAIPKLPAITVLGRCNELWSTLSHYITR